MNKVEDKTELRQQVLKRIAALDSEEKQHASKQICEQFTASIPWQEADYIAGYYALRSEVDITLLLDYIRNVGKLSLLPVVKALDAPLIFREYHGKGTLIQNADVNVYEPMSNRPIYVPQLIITPLVAFDDKGYRLGKGKGCYDITIAQLKEQADIITVGVAFACQQVDTIPVEAHDQRLDYIVTDKEIFAFT